LQFFILQLQLDLVNLQLVDQPLRLFRCLALAARDRPDFSFSRSSARARRVAVSVTSRLFI